MVYLICALIGLVTAFAGSLLGIGGGVILIPTMLFLYQYSDMFSWATPQTIVAISLITMIFTALSSSISHHKKGRIDYELGILFIIGGVPGSIFGSWLNHFVNTNSFSLYLGLLMLTLSSFFFLRRRRKSNEVLDYRGKNVRVFEVNGETYYYTVSIWVAFLLSLVVSTLSGLFGIGGGSIMVPAMLLLFNIPAHIATATSMFTIFFISFIGASTHIVLGHVVWKYAIFFIPGAWIGGTIGAKVNQRLNGNILEKLLIIVLIVLGLQLILT